MGNVFGDVNSPEGLWQTLFDAGLMKELQPELREPVKAMLTGGTPDFTDAGQKAVSDAAAKQPQQSNTPAPKPQAKPEPSVDSLSRRIYGK